MPTDSLSLAGGGSGTTAAGPAASTAHPTPSASTNFPDTYAETATADPADSPTSDIMDEVNNPLRLECDDGGVSESFTSLKNAWAYDGDLYSCTGPSTTSTATAGITSPLRWSTRRAGRTVKRPMRTTWTRPSASLWGSAQPKMRARRAC